MVLWIMLVNYCGIYCDKLNYSFRGFILSPLKGFTPTERNARCSERLFFFSLFTFDDEAVVFCASDSFFL